MARGRQTPAPGEIIASDWGGWVWDQSVQTFTSVGDRDAQFPAPQDGAITYQEDTDTFTVRRNGVWSLLQPAESGWVNGGSGASVIAADPTNITLSGSYVRTIGRAAFLYLSGTVKVAITVPTTGDITNVVVGQLAAAYTPVGVPVPQPLSADQTGRMLTGVINTAGQVSINAVGGSVNFTIGDAFTLAGTYYLS